MARVSNGDVALAVEIAGPGTGPPVLLLHGWPDTGEVWSAEVEALTDAGYRTVVPDLRGFGNSDKPEAVESYGLAAYLSDALAVLDELSIERAHVVGHDWGGIIGWLLAAYAPARVERLATISIGHPEAFASSGIEQRERSWYTLLFQFPDAATEWLTADNWCGLRSLGDHPRRASVVRTLEAPGALDASLKIYRANLHPDLVRRVTALPVVQAPTLIAFGSKDRMVTPAWVERSTPAVTDECHVERFDGCGHWPQLESPARFTEMLLAFLAGEP